MLLYILVDEPGLFPHGPCFVTYSSASRLNADIVTKHYSLLKASTN